MRPLCCGTVVAGSARRRAVAVARAAPPTERRAASAHRPHPGISHMIAVHGWLVGLWVICILKKNCKKNYQYASTSVFDWKFFEAATYQTSHTTSHAGSCLGIRAAVSGKIGTFSKKTGQQSRSKSSYVPGHQKCSLRAACAAALALASSRPAGAGNIHSERSRVRGRVAEAAAGRARAGARGGRR